MAEETINIVVKATDKTGGVFKGVAGKLGGIGKLAAGAAIAGVAAGGAVIAGVAAKGIQEFIQFEDQMNEVFTLLPGISGAAMEEMRGQVLDTAVEMGRLPEEVVPALYQSLSAGVPQDNVFEFLETAHKAALGGVTDLETAVDGISSVVNTYGSDVLSATSASDLMFTAVRLGKTTFGELSSSLSNVAPLASAMGVNFEDVTAALATMTSQGTDTATATTQMRGLLQELGDTGTEVGGIFSDIAGESFLDFVAGGGNVAEALQLLESYADEANIPLQNIFGNVRAGLGALQLTGSGMESFVGNLEDMQNASGATEEAFGRMNTGMARTVEVLQARFKTTFIKIGDALSPFVAFVGDKLMGVMEDLEPVIERVLDAFEFLFQMATDLGFDGLFEVFEDGSSVLGSFFEKLGMAEGPATDLANSIINIKDGITDFVETARTALEPIFQAVTQFVSWKDVLIALGIAVAAVVLPAIWSIITTLAPIIAAVVAVIAVIALLRNAWENDWLGIRTKLTEVWEGTIQPALILLQQWLQEHIPIAIAWLKDAWENTLLPAIQTVWAFIQDNVLPLLGEMVNVYFEAVKYGIQTMADYWTNTLWPALQNIWAFINDTLIPIFVAIADVISAVVQVAVEIFTGVWLNVFKPALETVWMFIQDVLIPIFEAVAEVVSAVVEVAVIALTGVWENVFLPAITAVWEFIRDKVIPIFVEVGTTIYEKLEPALTFIKGIFDKVKGAINGMKSAVGNLIGKLRSLADAIRNISLPDWLTPGSPTPFEWGIRGISEATRELARLRLPELDSRLHSMSGPLSAQQVTGLGIGRGLELATPVVPTGPTTHNTFNLHVATTGSPEAIIREFEHMKAMAIR